jgi:ubiquinone/menaquinone biosynthesis C-methylase UbiE
MDRKPQPSHSVLYEWFAPLYDLGVWLLALPFGGEDALREKVVGKASIRKGDKTLEIFSGTASLSMLAAGLGASATALDINTGMLKVARGKAVKAALRLGLVRADAAVLPFGEESFDRVMVSMGLHETESSNVPLILKECHRVLKQGGRLVVFDFHGADGGAGSWQSVFFTFFEGETAKAWVRSDIQSLLLKAGFRNFNREFLHSRTFQLLTVEKR